MVSIPGCHVLHSYYMQWNIGHGNHVDIIYLDFCKEFDCVPHPHLLSKLKAYGVSGSVLNWIKDFLSNR